MLAFSQQEFDDYVEREGWSDAESEASVVDDSALSFGMSLFIFIIYRVLQDY